MMWSDLPSVTLTHNVKSEKCFFLKGIVLRALVELQHLANAYTAIYSLIFNLFISSTER